MKSKTTQERLQKQLIQTRIANKEDKRQQIRKNIERSSRLLDNYYNPNLHSNHWQTTGAIKHKHNYIYGETGLGYKIPSFQNDQYNNNNTNSTINQRIIKQQMHYIEFDHLDDNEIIVTIEHCSECDKHQSHTNHINNIYSHIAKLIQKSILTRFPFIKVYLKPVDEDKLSSRIGAFEIQYASKINNQILIVPLFSKLNTGIWPSIYNVIYKISSLVPEFDVKCILYDGEEERNENINMNNHINQNSYLLSTKYENIKINLYQFDTNKIQQYSQEAKDAIDVIYNPKKKIMMYYENQSKNNSNSLMMLRPKSSKDNNSQNGKIIRSNSIQKQNYSMCSASTSSFGNYSAVSTHSQFNNNNNNNKSHLQLQHQLNFNKTNTLSNLHKLKQIDDSDVINSVKGKLLSSGYTNIEGVLTFHNVPYDTYIIEIENNRNFLQCATVLKFSHIMKTNINNSIYTINKIFRLKRQIDAYLEVYLYSNNNNNENDEMKLIENARVILIRNYSNEIVGLNSQLEDKFELKESEIVRGRYEIITTPGKMRLNVIKGGYQPIDKEIELKCGENKINIELQ